MAQAEKGKLNYRCPSCFLRDLDICPSCFLRDLDIDMFYDKDKDEYYCIRCQFTGTEKEVLNMNQMARVRYRAMAKRFTENDF